MAFVESIKSIDSKRHAKTVKQVFQEVEYIGKCIAETKASCQWVLSIPEGSQDKVTFTVQDSTLSGKKEILRNGVTIYSQIITTHPKEILYKDTLYNLTLDYFTYYKQHIIHIQILQKKGILYCFLPREYRLFVDGVNFNTLPTYFNQSTPSYMDEAMVKSYSQSISFEIPYSSPTNSLASGDRSVRLVAEDDKFQQTENTPRTNVVQNHHSSSWIIGRNY